VTGVDVKISAAPIPSTGEGQRAGLLRAIYAAALDADIGRCDPLPDYLDVAPDPGYSLRYRPSIREGCGLTADQVS
jgi:hypothetical protein